MTIVSEKGIGIHNRGLNNNKDSKLNFPKDFPTNKNTALTQGLRSAQKAKKRRCR